MLGCGKFLSVGGAFVVQQVVELLWACPLVVLYNVSVAGKTLYNKFSRLRTCCTTFYNLLWACSLSVGGFHSRCPCSGVWALGPTDSLLNILPCLKLFDWKFCVFNFNSVLSIKYKPDFNYSFTGAFWFRHILWFCWLLIIARMLIDTDTLNVLLFGWLYLYRIACNNLLSLYILLNSWNGEHLSIFGESFEIIRKNVR